MSTKSEAPAASPSARRLAEEHGVELGSINGTGPAGKITKSDVAEAAAALGVSTASPPISQASLPPAPIQTASSLDPNACNIAASPLAKRLAQERGIDLSAIQGSGPKGRIVKSDVETFYPSVQQEPALQPDAVEAKDRTPSVPVSPAPTGGTAANSELEAPYETQKLTSVRKVIARRLTEAKQTIPHFYLTADIRLDPLLDLRRQLNASLLNDGVKLSVNDLLIKALARALRKVPACNVSFSDDALKQYKREDISVAVAGPAGLITPVVRSAADKSLVTISSDMDSLAIKAREGKLKPHEYQGGTASLSNLGMFGIKAFSAVVNPPQGMILAVGAGEKRPIVRDHDMAVASVMSVTGSFDHRAIDGAVGAELIQAFRDCVEKPFSLVA